jgi:hypothetical protein
MFGSDFTTQRTYLRALLQSRRTVSRCQKRAGADTSGRLIPAFGMIDSRVLARGVIHFHLHDLIREGGNERSDWSSG